MGLFTKKNKLVKLQFCTNNIDRYYNDDHLDELEAFIEDYNIQVREMDCLSYCDECECSPYVLINNKFVEAKNPQDLINKIKEQL